MLVPPGERTMPLWPQVLTDLVCAEANQGKGELRIEAVKVLQTAYCDIDWKEYGSNVWAKNEIIDRILPALDENVVAAIQHLEDGDALEEDSEGHELLQFLGLAAFPFINYFYESMIDYAAELEENDIFLLLSKRLRDNISTFVQMAESDKDKSKYDLIAFDVVTAQVCITALSGIDFESFFEQEHMAEKEENYKAEMEKRQSQKKAAQRWKRVKALRKFVGLANVNAKKKKKVAPGGEKDDGGNGGPNRPKKMLSLRGVNTINAVFQFAQKRAPEQAVASLFSVAGDPGGTKAKDAYAMIRDITLGEFMQTQEHVRWEDLASNFMEEMATSRQWFPHTRNLVRRIAEERHGDPEFLIKALQVCETIVMQAPEDYALRRNARAISWKSGGGGLSPRGGGITLTEMQNRFDEIGGTKMFMQLLSFSANPQADIHVLKFACRMMNGGNNKIQTEVLKYIQTDNHFLRISRYHLQKLYKTVRTYNVQDDISLTGGQGVSSPGVGDVGAAIAMGDEHSFKVASAQAGDENYMRSLDEEFEKGELLLRFLQLCCEGHFEELQDFLREQDYMRGSINLLKEIKACAYGVCSRISGRTIDLATQTLETITEFVQGPNLVNQKVIGDGSFFKCVNMMMQNPCVGCTNQQRRNLKVSCTRLLLSILEGCKAVETPKNIIRSLSLDDLLSFLDEISPETDDRDVATSDAAIEAR